MDDVTYVPKAGDGTIRQYTNLVIAEEVILLALKTLRKDAFRNISKKEKEEMK